MRKSLLATGAGMLLAACGALQAPGHYAAFADAGLVSPEPLVTALERACLADPMNASHWERLAAALESEGQRDRAGRMREQAASLRAHDARNDYALLNARAVAVEAPSSMPRTLVRRIGAAMVQVERSAPTMATTSAAAVASPPSEPLAALVRLEISNGNGVTGAAARLGRSLDVDGWKRVRLTNVKNFDVPLSRIEYRQDQRMLARSLSLRLGLPLEERTTPSSRSDLRIVLGQDLKHATARPRAE